MGKSEPSGLWLSRIFTSNTLAFTLAAVSIVAGIITYLALTQYSLLSADPATVSGLLALDLILLASLAAVISGRVLSLIKAQRQGMAGAKLQLKLVLTFTMLAVAPAVAVAGLSALFFFGGVQAWFDDTVSAAVSESKEVAEAALEANKRTILGDALALANVIEPEVRWGSVDEVRVEQLLLRESLTRNLTQAIIFGKDGRVLARSDLGLSLKFDTILDIDYDRAKAGEVVLISDSTDDRVQALLQLLPESEIYLLIGRQVDAVILGHMAKAERASNQYASYEQRRIALQRSIMLIFVIVAMVLLTASVLLGLEFASRLTRPISNLIVAAERVRAGDFTVRVEQSDRSNEIGMLIRSFNRMTNQLQTQRRDIMEANRQIDERRRFTEAVLAGVSAGVLDVDAHGVINLANSHAAEFLGVTCEQLVGQSITGVLPALLPLSSGERQLQVNNRQLLIRTAAELVGDEVRGYVITLDEVTALIAAQRKAAWADVARRIAHEIKNPLTPIQLSADRLRRKYGKEIVTEPEVFRDCTETIVRQVDDIRRLIDEFSAFARMPAPVIRDTNVSALLREVVILHRHANAGVEIISHLPDEDLWADCDAAQLRQAVTNLILNGLDAVAERDSKDGVLPIGQIAVSLRQEGERVVIAVADNGVGLPTVDRDKLTDPYVTTKVKGTGLGLAIVSSIMQDHQGKIELVDVPTGGAVVRLSFPYRNGVNLLKSGEVIARETVTVE